MDEQVMNIGTDATAIIEFAKKRCEPQVIVIDHEEESAPAFVGHDANGAAYIKSVSVLVALLSALASDS
jgi:hypothetical protein